ncbi:hypothetical protein [Paenibacillus sp. 7516]|uniref:hypothetical protein n=1 Tax=Paenibacillus sp. 7516 TaxID=2022549 RepID=UPI000BA516C9|nr:hypothetical protein [Paenibacillus sp. 7516]PAF31520.1 hypothetical protein CHI14_13500 [Paenibacillus sp. 7516]
MIKVEYKDTSERQEIIDQYKDKFLVEDQILFDGNFLIFSDTKPTPPIVYICVPQEEFEFLKQESTEQGTCGTSCIHR